MLESLQDQVDIADFLHQNSFPYKNTWSPDRAPKISLIDAGVTSSPKRASHGALSECFFTYTHVSMQLSFEGMVLMCQKLWERMIPLRLQDRLLQVVPARLVPKRSVALHALAR